MRITNAGAGSGGAPPQLLPVCELRVRVSDPQEGEYGLDGLRRVTRILGGELRALPGAAQLGLANLYGEVLPGGADHQLVRPDGTIEIDARYRIETVGGHLIGVCAAGLRRAETSGVYFRVAIRFDAEHPAHAALTQSVFIADGVREEDCVRHTVYRVA